MRTPDHDAIDAYQDASNELYYAEILADLAGILARGYDWHIDAHGPDGSFAVRTDKGDRYEVVSTAEGATSFIEYRGHRYSVTVAPEPV